MKGKKKSTSTTTNTTITESVSPLTGAYYNDYGFTAADVVLLSRFLAEDASLTDEQVADIRDHEPDYNCDGLVTVLDAGKLSADLQAGDDPDSWSE